jgi:hypothetical protein
MRRSLSELMLVRCLLPNTPTHLGLGPDQALERVTIHRPGSARFAGHCVAG